MSFHTLENHSGEETSINSASSTYGIEEGKTCLFPKIGLPGYNSQAKGINKRGHKLLTKEER